MSSYMGKMIATAAGFFLFIVISLWNVDISLVEQVVIGLCVLSTSALIAGMPEILHRLPSQEQIHGHTEQTESSDHKVDIP